MFDLEQCWDCDGLEISYKFIRTEANGDTVYEAFCRFCNANWEVSENE